jgi:hypothetical protein
MKIKFVSLAGSDTAIKYKMNADHHVMLDDIDLYGDLESSIFHTAKNPNYKTVMLMYSFP